MNGITLDADKLINKERVQEWPTPTASMGHWNSGIVDQFTTHDTNQRLFELGLRGYVNPEWVEWLMGFNLDWTV